MSLSKQRPLVDETFRVALALVNKLRAEAWKGLFDGNSLSPSGKRFLGVGALIALFLFAKSTPREDYDEKGKSSIRIALQRLIGAIRYGLGACLMLPIPVTIQLTIMTVFVFSPLYLAMRLSRPWTSKLAKGYSMGLLSGDSLFISTILLLVFYHLLPPKPIPDATSTPRSARVCVVGSGLAGVVTAKELLEEGHDVTVFERYSSWGGVWAKGVGPGAWDASVTTSSALNTGFSDFWLPTFYPENKHRYHATHGQYWDYLSRYVKHYDLQSHMVFNSVVTSVRETVDKDKPMWTVEVMKTDGSKSLHYFDGVAVCTGINQIPRWPEGIEKFQGIKLHAGWYNSEDAQEQYKGKRVLIVGNGETASDIIPEIVDTTSFIALSTRSRFLVLPRDFNGRAIDYGESRALFSCPPFVRYLYLIPTLIHYLVLHPIWTDRRVGASLLTFIKCNKPRGPGETNPPKLSWCQLTKSDKFMPFLENGRCAWFDGVQEYKSDGVVFTDGREVKFDVIIFATGYQIAYPFLEKPHHVRHTGLDRYNYTFHPELPNIGFIGLVRGHIGSITTESEMLARWYSLVMSGRRVLPSAERMKSEIAERKRVVDGKFDTRATMALINYVARNFVGCEPNGLQLFMKSPTLWFKVYNSAFAAAQFRFRGPHAKPETVTKFYDDVDVGWTPGALALYLCLWTMSPFWNLFSQIPFLEKIPILRDIYIPMYSRPF